MTSSPKRKLLIVITVFVILVSILVISGCVEDKPKSTEVPKNYTNSLGMEFVLIPAGEFQMGSDPYPNKPFDFDTPVHNVTIQKPFNMSKYEVTPRKSGLKSWAQIPHLKKATTNLLTACFMMKCIALF